jgi:hypothetical protein
MKEESPADLTALPTRETLLGLLESELALLSQQQTNSGWTSWAITGAIGALVWMLLGQWESGWPAGNTWALAYLSFTVGGVAVMGFMTTVQSQNLVSSRKTRFHLGYSNFGKQRPSVFWGILQGGIVTFIVFWCHASLAVRWMVLSWSGTALLVYVLAIILSYTEFPFNAQISSVRLKPRILLLIHGTVAVYVWGLVFLLVRELMARMPSSADIKVGGLLAAIYFLISRIFEDGGSRSLIDNLLRVRRELALGDMSVKDAARHVEIEFLGMQVSDVFQSAVQEFLAQVGELAVQCQDCIGRLDAAVASLGDGAKLPVDQQMNLARSVLEVCQPKVQVIAQKLNELGAAYSKFESRSRSLSPSEDARLAVVGILTRLNGHHREVHAYYLVILDKMKWLELKSQAQS